MERVLKKIVTITALIVLLTISTVAFSGIGRYFIDPKIDSTNISNIGFLVLIALSTALFNWAKSITPKPNDLFDNGYYLNRGAIYSIVAAICFIIGSLFKYDFLHYKNVVNTPYFSESADKGILILGNAICIIIAAIFTFYVFIVIGISFYDFVVNQRQ